MSGPRRAERIVFTHIVVDQRLKLFGDMVALQRHGFFTIDVNRRHWPLTGARQGNTDIGEFGFTRPVDHTAHHRHDNNTAERQIRPIVLGRRNYLFAGSDAGGERAANLYSLIGTALLNSQDPYLYLRHALERIAEHPINRIDQLLPWHVALEMPAERLRA